MDGARRGEHFGLALFFRRRGWPLVFILLAVVFLALSLVDGVLSPSWLRWALGVSAPIGILGAFLWRYIPSRQRDAPGPPLPISPALGEIEESEASVKGRYDVAALEYFNQVQIGLPHHLARVNEHALLMYDYVRLTTSLSYRLTDDVVAHGVGPLLVPVATCRRGVLLDSFSVRASDGSTLTTLSRRDTDGLVAFLIRSIVDTAVSEGGGSHAVVSSAALELTNRLITQVACHCERMTDQKREEIRSLLSQVDGLSAEFDAEWAVSLKNICRALSTSYLVVAEVPRNEGRHVTIEYVHDRPLERSTISRYERFRARLGLTPYGADIALARMLQTDNYHLQVEAPPGQYLHGMGLALEGSDSRLTQDHFRDRNGNQPYIRVRQSGRRSMGHLYVRRQGSARHAQIESYRAIVGFREIPPGPSGLAAVLMALATFLIGVITMTGIGLRGEAPGGNADVTAFLLAAPAFVAAALSHWSGDERITRSSLTSFFALMLATIVSIGSAITYVWDSSRDRVGPYVTTLAGGLVRVEGGGPVWLSFFMISGIITLYLAAVVYNETRYYSGVRRQTRSRRDRDNAVAGGSP